MASAALTVPELLETGPVRESERPGKSQSLSKLVGVQALAFTDKVSCEIQLQNGLG